MKKEAYIIECYRDKRHEIPVVLQIEDEDKKGSTRTIEIQCPVCGAWNVATFDKNLVPDATAIRGVKKI